MNAEPLKEEMKRGIREIESDAPLVTVTDTVADRVIESVCEVGSPVRLLMSETAINNLAWTVRGSLSRLLSRGSSLRAARTESVVIVGNDRISMLDPTPHRPSVLTGPVDDATRDRYETAWRSSTKSITVDGESFDAAVDAVDAVGRREDLKYVCGHRRGPETDPLRVTVWALSSPHPHDAPQIASLIDRADDFGVSRETVRRRADTLANQGVVSLVPAPNHDGRGRPPNVVVRRACRPLSTAAFQSLIC